MGLGFIIGGSGTGKSYYGYETIIREAERHPDVLYYVIVPEQYTMQTQKTIVNMSPRKGILNIDVVSFQRLAFQVIREAGGGETVLLDDMGKSMILRRLSAQHEKELPYLGKQMRNPGSLDEVKSLISEFMQYDIDAGMLSGMEKDASKRPLLAMKLRDMRVLYGAFREYLKGHYMTGEESMDRLASLAEASPKLKNSVILLDGFTGFTPIQIKVIRALLKTAAAVSVTVTMDAQAVRNSRKNTSGLFCMSNIMMRSLIPYAAERKEDILLNHGDRTRFRDERPLRFLEENLFRYRNRIYEEEQENIRVFTAVNPEAEIEETAQRIGRMVRQEGIRYGEIGVITGNLEEYASVVKQVFAGAGIPCFIDETHTVLMNPFVEFIRAALFMLDQDFSFESVMRYLRCGISCITREEADRLENYIRAVGIRSLRGWQKEWVRLYKGMDPEEILLLNSARERFLEETQSCCAEMSEGSRTASEFCRILYEFIVRCGVQEKLKEEEMRFHELGDPAMEREYARIYGIVMQLLDRMVEILGEEEMTRDEFARLLETGLGAAKIALIPPGQDQVLVGDMERTRLKDIEALFFVGVNDGNIPKHAESGGILTDMDRDFFADSGIVLAPDPKQQIEMQRFYLYLNLTKPRKYLTLSYVLTDGKGEAQAPSYLVRSVKKLFPGLCIETAAKPGEDGGAKNILTPGTGLKVLIRLLSEKVFRKEDPLFGELFGWYLRSPEFREDAQRLARFSVMTRPEDHISKEAARILYKDAEETNATRLEQFAACAFAHFLRYALKLSERTEYELNAADLGNLVHQSLQEYSVEIRKEGYSWKNVPDEVRERLIDSCLQKVAADYGNTIMKSTSRNEAMLERAGRLLRRTVWALGKHLENGSFEPEGFEVRYAGGRIDRIDVCEEPDKVFVKVIDYKTGNTSFDLLSVYHGLQLQLVVYLDGAVRTEEKKHPGKEIVPAGIFYYRVSDPMISEPVTADLRELKDLIFAESDGTGEKSPCPEVLEKKILKALKMSGLAAGEREILERIDSTFASIPAGFTKDGTPTKASSVADVDQFKNLTGFVRKQIRSFQERILQGEAEAVPYRKKGEKACTYCPYTGVCGFDRKIPGFRYNDIRPVPEGELWKRIMTEAGQEVK